jgi:hypothetical protein
VTVEKLLFQLGQTQTADELLAEIRDRGGRVYRMQSERVFCLTDNAELAEWLLAQGGRPYSPRNIGRALAEHPPGAYYRAGRGGTIEYDCWIDPIPVSGESLWEALA